MSIPARYENGVFKPLEEVPDAAKGEVYRVFSEEELHRLKDELVWLKASERSFEFWDNGEDAIYDNL
jgi:predicted DNA-binding antitoxin AbrB/MazE fold protein